MNCDDVIVEFDIYLSEENFTRAKQEGLLKKFKLTTTISTSNMHLFDPKGVIKKYDTPEQSMCLRKLTTSIPHYISTITSFTDYDFPSLSS